VGVPAPPQGGGKNLSVIYRENL